MAHLGERTRFLVASSCIKLKQVTFMLQGFMLHERKKTCYRIRILEGERYLLFKVTELRKRITMQ